VSGGPFDEDVPTGLRDADLEMAALEDAGRRFSRSAKRSRVLFAAGRIAEAAQACPHGGGYLLNSLAAVRENDPRQGQAGVRCDGCGSALSCWPWDGTPDVIAPCEFRPPRAGAIVTAPAKHAHEKWTIKPGISCTLVDENGTTLAEFASWMWSEYQVPLLVAAAPDLLAALKGLLDAASAFRALPEGAPGSAARIKQDAHIAAEDAARAAIAKAEGGTP
jgi:hypothetical protein